MKKKEKKIEFFYQTLIAYKKTVFFFKKNLKEN